MNKQKAIQVINGAPDDWEYFAASNERFYKKDFDRWFFFNCSYWAGCEKFNPLYSTLASMIPKSEILKIAEGEEMRCLNTENISKAKADLINDLCPNEKAKFDEWFDELKSRYLHVIGYIDIKYWYDVFMSGADTDEAATMIQTPCIMKFKDDYLLYFDDVKHFNLTTMELRSSAIESCDSNVTNQYLQNTYGEVVSPEHAEFIIELAKNAGFKFGSTKPDLDSVKSFMIYEDSFDVYSRDKSMLSNECSRKQITIPLPPKFNKTSEILNPNNADVKLGKPEPLKNAGDNLILGCEDSKCDEWPQVGSTVTWGSGHAGIVKSISDGFAWVKRSDNSQYITLYVSSLKKPKTPEEELRDDIKQEIFSSLAIMPELLARRDLVIELSGHIASNLIDKYKIKPQ